MRPSKVFLTAALLLTSPGVALGHGGANAGGTTRLVVGWAQEPPFAGFPNAVDVRVEHDGQPRAGAKLDVIVIYGGEDGENRTEPLPLDPNFGDPGGYHANLIPTAAGKYTFVITGQVAEDQVDLTMTSGPNTFDDVQEPTESQFPETVPGPVEQRDAIETAQTSASDAQLAADTALDDAGDANTMAMASLGVGVLALLLALAALIRRPRRT